MYRPHDLMQEQIKVNTLLLSPFVGSVCTTRGWIQSFILCCSENGMVKAHVG